MTLSDLISKSKVQKVRIPKELLSSESLQQVIAAGMSVIRKDLVQASRLAGAALVGARRLKSSADLGGAHRLAGHMHLLGGKAKRALPHYRAARQAFSDYPQERAATAVAMLQALAYSGEYEEAFLVAEEALSTFREEGDSYRAARVSANMANALHRLDRLDEARFCYQEAMSVLVKAEAASDLAIVARNYGVCLMSLGDYEEADRMYAVARRVFEEAGETSLLLEIDLNRAYLLGRTGLIRQAILSFRNLRESLPKELGFEVGHSLLDQADFMLEVGLWTDAGDAARRAGEEFERLGVRFELGKARLIEAWSLVKRGRFIEGSERLKEAKRRLSKEPNQTWQALALQATAELDLARSKPARAYQNLLKAKGLKPTHHRAGSIHDLLLDLAIEQKRQEEAESLAKEASLAYRAKHAVALGRIQEAESLAKQALEVYDQERAFLGPSLLREAIAAARASELRECFRVLRSPKDRLESVARLKNQSLAEITFSPESAGSATNLRSRRSQLFLEGGCRDAKVEDSLAAAWREARLESESSLAASASLPDMPVGSAFVELFQDQGKVFAFTCQGSEVSEFELGALDEFLKQSRLLRMHLARRDPSPQGTNQILSWFGAKLAPILSPSLDTLIIGRDFPLSNAPLHAALIGGRHLFQTVHVVYAPSASSWQAVHSRKGKACSPPLVVGFPDDLAPQISREMSRVSSLLGTVTQSPDQIDSKMPDASLVHIAAHGLIREDRPLFSSLRLGDKNLSVFDFMQMSLSASLVTLSGCSTGTAFAGETNDSEGFIEAILAAGAKSVLASLWEVADEAASLWMESFYSDVSERGAKQAYRAACLRIMETHPHPASWAPFALFGDPT